MQHDAMIVLSYLGEGWGKDVVEVGAILSCNVT